jgi:hypothetical protein
MSLTLSERSNRGGRARAKDGDRRRLTSSSDEVDDRSDDLYIGWTYTSMNSRNDRDGMVYKLASAEVQSMNHEAEPLSVGTGLIGCSMNPPSPPPCPPLHFTPNLSLFPIGLDTLRYSCPTVTSL